MSVELGGEEEGWCLSCVEKRMRRNNDMMKSRDSTSSLGGTGLRFRVSMTHLYRGLIGQQSPDQGLAIQQTIILVMKKHRLCEDLVLLYCPYSASLEYLSVSRAF